MHRQLIVGGGATLAGLPCASLAYRLAVPELYLMTVVLVLAVGFVVCVAAEVVDSLPTP